MITDPGATITANTGCVSNGPHQVTCSPTDVHGIFIYLADLNDRATIDASVPSLPGDTYYNAAVAMEGYEGNDTLNGGINTTNNLMGDTPFFETLPGDGNDILNGGNKQDQLVGTGGNDLMNGAGDYDSFNGGDGNDVMNGGPGGDQFSGGGAKDGADVVTGGPDQDSYGASDRENPVHISLNGVADDGEGCPGAACEGDNIGADVESLQGTDGNDVLSGSAGANSFSGGDGDDTINGLGGADGIFGGRGNDLLHGGSGADRIGGFEGLDRVFGDAGDDTIFSTDVDDDPDRYSGGKGTDLADYSGANAAVAVNLDNKANDGVAGEKDNVLADVEDVLGSDFNDVLTGSKRANQFEGGDGNDRLTGKAGADGLIGGRGADRLIGGKGPDLLDGGPAPDRLLSRDGHADEVDCGSSVDHVKGDRVDRLAGDCDKAALAGRRF